MKTSRLALILLGAILMVACGDDDGDIIIERNTQPKISNVNNNRNTSGPKAAQTRYEFPKLKGGKSDVVIHECILNSKTKEHGINYSLEWDHQLRATRWVCYQVYSSIRMSNVSRPQEDPWAYDPNIKESEQQRTYNELSGSRPPLPQSTYYEKGHIVASADRLGSREANNQTFYMTNIYPMVHDFNGGIWASMEARVRSWGSKSDSLYVCKGGTVDHENDILDYTTGNHIVPRYFYMAILSKKSSQWQATALWIEHQDGSNWKSLQDYAVSIDRLEQLTGLDFFCNLPDEIEDKVEASINYTYWGFK